MLGGQFEYQHEYSADGSVGWMDQIPIEAEHNSGNTGDNPIELIYVTLKNEKPISKKYNNDHQLYPNVNLELLLNNHRFVVQKVILEPGQWEGAHRNQNNQIWIMVRGGIFSAKKNGQFDYQKKEIHTHRFCCVCTQRKDKRQQKHYCTTRSTWLYLRYGMSKLYMTSS